MIWDDEIPGKAGLHHCFACDFSGNIVQLVQHVRGGTEKDAKRWLYDSSQGTAADPVQAVRIEVQRARKLELPDGIVFAPLLKWITPAREYALSRGIEPWQVDRWRIGYSVEGRLAFRIVIVTRDKNGTPLNYTARTFVDDERRYNNGREEEGIDHGGVFGEEHWPEIDQRDTALVIEGALNGLAGERVLPGMPIAGLSGSHLHPAHVAKLGTFKRLLVATDADAAGDKVAVAVQHAVGRWVRVDRARPPEVPGKKVDLAAMAPDDRRALLEGALCRAERIAS
jgi:DNA primase